MLVIDDEVGVREAVRDVLEVSGLKVLMAESGEAGLAVYQARQSDIGLILLDLSMPGLSREETLQRLFTAQSCRPSKDRGLLEETLHGYDPARDSRAAFGVMLDLKSICAKLT